MRKFSKILTLILALAVILTAFTVVALAADETPPIVAKTIDFSSTTVGNVYDTSGNKITEFSYGEDYPGGNKYLVYNSKTSSSSKLFYENLGVAKDSEEHKVKFRPILAYDFDFMTPTGNLGYRDQNENSAGITFRPYYQQSGYGTAASVVFPQITFKDMGLSNKAYLWQHVTLILVHEEAYTFSVYVSINGADPKPVTINTGPKDATKNVEFYKYDLTAKFPNPGNATEIMLGRFAFEALRYGYDVSYPDATGYQYIDNFQGTYFSPEYKDNLKAVSTYVYNGDHTTPESYKGTVATITVGEGDSAVTKYYDDINKAAEFAKENPGSEMISLEGNITAPYIVDTELTINAGDYTGVDTYAMTTEGYYIVETDEPGVYESVKGDFMLTTGTNVGIAYPASELVAKLRSPGSGSTIKLLDNVEIDPSLSVTNGSTDVGAIQVGVPFTLDLNGYELRRVYYYGNQYDAVLGADGEYEYGDVGTAVPVKNTYFFQHSAKVALTITSTAGTNGKIYNVGARCDTWVNEKGEVVKRDITSYCHGGFIYTIQDTSAVYVSNVDIYDGHFFNAPYGGRFVTLHADNVNYYQMTPGTAQNVASNAQWALEFHGEFGYDIQVSDSFFYLNAPIPDDYTNGQLDTNGKVKYGTTGLIRVTNASLAGKTVNSIFTNCDIITAEGKHLAGIMNSNADETLVFEDCRFYNNVSAQDFVASKGTLSNSGYVFNETRHAYSPIAMGGWINKTLAQNITKTYTVPAVDGWCATADAVQSVNFNFATKEQDCTFNCITTQEVSVQINGEPVQLFPGVSDLYTKALRIYAEDTDNLLNTIYLLQDANGNIYKSALGLTENGFAFDWDSECILSASDETKLVGGIEADFNLGFLSGFRYNLYIPVDNRLSDVDVAGFKQGENTVLIDGKEYTVWYKLVGTAAAAEANTISATFNVGGAEYSQTWSINAIQYASLLLDQPDLDKYPNEAKALGTMAKLIKEAVALTGSSADVEAIDALITKAGVEPGYGDYTTGNANALSPLSDVIDSAQFVIYSGVASYKFNTKVENPELTFTVNGKDVGFVTGGNAEKGYYVILDAMRVYDLIDTLHISYNGIGVDYEFVDYLTGMENAIDVEGNPVNNDLAKALYEFGLAAKDYKADIMANN